MPLSMMPRFISATLTRPVSGLKSVSMTEAMMGQERKCGRYRMVWETFL